ncbi:hypothetical protein NL676_024880 [Syzygium grande]|nr:hypothetical protein NL676_024880 [Syzygium grande]
MRVHRDASNGVEGGESIRYLGGTATDFSEDDLLEAIDALVVLDVHGSVPRLGFERDECRHRQQRRRRVDGEEEEEEQGRPQEEECGGP